MSTLKRAVTAAACTIGLAAGAVAMAVPAHAAVVTYDCVDPNGVLGPWNNVDADWQSSSGFVLISTTFPSPQVLQPNQIWTVVNGTQVANVSTIPVGGNVELGPTAVSGTVTPSNPLVLYVDNDLNGSADVEIHCTA
ncbi:hypothetical protein LO772_10915 [Yinghuangia sp. ASG 101]|uniref:hypothetical protein n=1 Tax=Yinghuangia sp. ASG 101 TaxID=2896848 RepID=UPI001E633A3C|nr:hypothetical protein [Yinghuangia sp. ASG 101]UGQ14062.1 hypothetical protein LO772_10915 [Yinghuangia sp. ASG 101]